MSGSPSVPLYGTTLLPEFALTLDIFDESLLAEDATVGVTIVELLKGLCRFGLVADLNKNQWSRHLQEQRIPRLHAASLASTRDKIVRHLERLAAHGRLVRHPQRLRGIPTDREWLDIALQSHASIPLHGIVVGPALWTCYTGSDSRVVDVASILDSVIWECCGTSIELRKCEADYRRVLTPLLRHASSLTLVDPYLSLQPRFLSTVQMCAELLGQRWGSRLVGRIHIHAGDPRPTSWGGTVRPPDWDDQRRQALTNRLDDWENAIRVIQAQYPHRFRIFLWANRDETMHDRYLLTNQCGVAVPAGLDQVTYRPNTTEWYLMSDEDWQKRREEYDLERKNGVGLDLLGKREINP